MSEVIVSEQHKQAVELHQKIIVSAQLAQKNLWDMCINLKQMRDGKLYKELGYNDFANYCENEVGLKRTQAYSYIAIVEKVSPNFVQSNEQIGIQKLYLLSTISESEQQQIVEKINLEDTTVRELKAEIDKLKEENKGLEKRAENAEFHQNTVQNAYEHLEKTNAKHYKNYRTEQGKRQKLEEENSKLRTNIKELENRPIEVAVADNPELTIELKNAKATIKQLGCKLSEADNEKANEVMKAIRDTWSKANEEKEKLIAEYEQKLAEQQNSENDVDKAICDMQILLIYNATEMLIKAINETSKLNTFYRSKIKDKVEISLNGIKDMLENLK